MFQVMLLVTATFGQLYLVRVSSTHGVVGWWAHNTHSCLATTKLTTLIQSMALPMLHQLLTYTLVSWVTNSTFNLCRDAIHRVFFRFTKGASAPFFVDANLFRRDVDLSRLRT